MRLLLRLINVSRRICSNRPANSLQFIFEVAVARLKPKVVSLIYGSQLEQYSITSHIKECVVEQSPNTVVSVRDGVIEGLTHRHTFSDRAIYRLRDATFDPTTGDTFVGDKLILEAHLGGLARRTLKVKRFDRPLIGVPFQTHYHWLIETLPRIIAATHFEPTALLVAPTRLSAMQREAIGMLGHEVLYTDHCCQSNDYILATRGRDSGWAHPMSLDLLRSTYGVPSKAGTDHIFITRSYSSRSDAISVAMHEFAVNTGWNVLVAEELTFKDRLSLFGQASVIAGEHGAGLANLALAPLSTQLIEFLNPSLGHPAFNFMSLVLNNNISYYSAYPRRDYEHVLLKYRQNSISPLQSKDIIF